MTSEKHNSEQPSEQPRYEHHEIMTLHEVADYLGLHYLTIYRLIQERRIPAARVGGRWRFKKDVLDRWIENDMNGRISRRRRSPSKLNEPPKREEPPHPDGQDRQDAA